VNRQPLVGMGRFPHILHRLTLYVLQAAYVLSVVLLVLAINFEPDLDSSFYVLGGEADEALNPVHGHFKLPFLLGLAATTAILLITAYWFVKGRTGWFKSLLIGLNFLFIYGCFQRPTWMVERRVFDGYSFNPLTDNGPQAGRGDGYGILFHSVSDVAMLSICLLMLALVWLRVRFKL